MIEIIEEAPVNTVAFRAIDDVTKEDFDNVVIPAVKRQVSDFKELNYLMVVDTSLSNWTAGAWFKDMFVGLKNLTKWRKAAILTDSGLVNTFTNIIGILVPGEFKGFKRSEFHEAMKWVST